MSCSDRGGGVKRLVFHRGLLAGAEDCPDTNAAETLNAVTSVPYSLSLPYLSNAVTAKCIPNKVEESRL